MRDTSFTELLKSTLICRAALWVASRNNILLRGVSYQSKEEVTI